MRILLSSYQCLPNEGSELGNGWQWARALARRGHEVTVLADPIHFRWRGRPEPEAPIGVRFLYVDPLTSPLTRVALHLGPSAYYLRWQDAALRYMRGRADHYDVVHHVSWGSLQLGSALWRLPVPLVYGPIGGGQTAPGAYWRSFGRRWPGEALRTAATRSLRFDARSRETVRNAAVTLVTNSATAEACRRLGAPDVRFMLAEGLPQDWSGLPRTQPGGTPVVLWVGRMLARKAPLLALQAFAELRRELPARLVMAGDGPLLGRVRAAVDRLGLADDVELLGRVPWAEIGGLYDAASVFLFTSLRDSSGSQFLEALGRGLPAVALDHHGIGDFDVRSAAVKVALPRRPDELPGRVAAALRTVLSDGTWQTRSADGVTWASGHTWPAKAAAADRLYEEILSGSHAATATTG